MGIFFSFLFRAPITSDLVLLQKTSNSDLYLTRDNYVCKTIHSKIMYDREITILKILSKRATMMMPDRRRHRIMLPLYHQDPAHQIFFHKADMDLCSWLAMHEYNDLFLARFSRLMLQLETGYHFLYDHHIEHYDLKPENILLFFRVNGIIHLQISDFGLSVHEAQAYQMNCGTISYMAPEINTMLCITVSQSIFDYQPHSMDIYSIACIIAYALYPLLHFTFHGHKEKLWDIYDYLDLVSHIHQQPHCLLQGLLLEGLRINPVNRISVLVFLKDLRWLASTSKLNP